MSISTYVHFNTRSESAKIIARSEAADSEQ